MLKIEYEDEGRAISMTTSDSEFWTDEVLFFWDYLQARSYIVTEQQMVEFWQRRVEEVGNLKSNGV
jgi:hypothetical protein